MLKINNVSYDICTKGPAISHPTLILDFEPVESYDGDLFEDFKKLMTNPVVEGKIGELNNISPY